MESWGPACPFKRWRVFVRQSRSPEVENMTQCDESTSMLQCGSGYAARFHFAGESAAPLQNFKSKAVRLTCWNTGLPRVD